MKYWLFSGNKSFNCPELIVNWFYSIIFHFLTRKELKEFLRDNEISIRIDNCAANLHPKIFPKGRRNRFVPWANFASGNLARGWPRVGSNCYRVLHYKDSCVYLLPWTPRTTTNGEHVKHTKMPTQSKKSVSITTSERPAKPKKKKKKESGRNSRNSFSKTPTSGVDSSCEGLFQQCCLSITLVKRNIRMNILIWKGSQFPDAKFRDSFQEEKATVWWNLKDLYKVIRL